MSAKRRKHVPLRSCIACRETFAKRELIRIVRTPQGNIEIDPKGKAAGRGAYLCRKRRCWEAGLTERRLAQALQCQVTAEELAALSLAMSSLFEGEMIGSEALDTRDTKAEANAW